MGTLFLKESFELKPEQAELLYSGSFGFLDTQNSTLCGRLYGMLSSGGIEPKFFISHMREEYVYEKVRMFFEHDIRTWLIGGKPTSTGQGIIFKIVYGDFLPKNIGEMIMTKTCG